MARIVQPSLNGGEISDHLQARVDLALYQKSLKKARNFFIRRTGGVSTRPGSRAHGRASDQAAANRLCRFVYSRDQSYLIEFYVGRIAIWYRGARILSGSPLTPTAVVAVAETFTLDFAAPHGLVSGEVVEISGATGTGAIDHLNADHRVTVLSATSIEVPKWTAEPAAYTSGASVARTVTVANPYSQEDLATLRFTQSADVMTVTSRRHLPRELRRTGATTWTFNEVVSDRGPFKKLNQDEAIRVYASAQTGTVTVTSVSPIFTDGHIGALFYIEERNFAAVSPWEAGKLFAFNYANGSRCRNDGKVYVCTTAYYNQYWHMGTVPPTHEAGKARDGNGWYNSGSESYRAYGVEWEYEHSGYGIVRITAVSLDGRSCTATVTRTLPSSVVGGSSAAAGPWTMTGDGIDDTLTITGATSTVEEQFVVTLDDAPLAPSQYSVSGATMTFVDPPGVGVVVSVYQHAVDNLTDFWAFGAWSEAEGYPGCTTYDGDRLMYAATEEDPQRIDGSRVGDYNNFLSSVPLQDDDPIQTTVGGRERSAVTDLVPIDRLLALTAAGVFRVGAAENDILTPGTASPRLLNSVGAADIPAVMVRKAALFVERGRRRIAELSFADLGSADANDITVLADHFWRRNHRITAMNFADDPYGLLYTLRSDGAAPVLAYMREQEVMGWSMYTTDGIFEQICVVPEGDTDVVYATVRRTDATGSERRLIESFTAREPEDDRDIVCVDAALTYDRRNTTSDAVAVTQLAGSWTAGALLQVASFSAVSFGAADIGDEVWLYGASATLKVTITAVSGGGTIVHGTADIDVPVDLQGVATTAWAVARDTFAGLTHIAGRTGAAQVDGLPYDGAVEISAAGVATLGHCAAVVHIGLPFECYIETLDLNVVGRGTVRPHGKTVSRVSALISESRGLWAGPDRDHLEEWAGRDVEDAYDVPEPFTGLAEVELNSTWEDRGSTQIWQLAPAPLTVLAVIPSVVVGSDH